MSLCACPRVSVCARVPVRVYTHVCVRVPVCVHNRVCVSAALRTPSPEGNDHPLCTQAETPSRSPAWPLLPPCS